jgi:hypothetical protein
MQAVFIVLALVTLFPIMLCCAASYSLSIGIVVWFLVGEMYTAMMMSHKTEIYRGFSKT